MQLSVKGKQIDVGDALRGHVEASLAGIVEKYFEKAIEAHAVFSRQGHLIRSDISVHLRRDILVQGQASAADAYAAFDGAAEHIAKRIRRYKRRLRGRHGQGHEAAADRMSARSYVLADEAEDSAESASDGADQPVIVAEMTLEIPSLTVGEAVMRMDLADVPSFMFRNRAHGGLNVVYRRRDGHVGWVDPDLNGSAAGGKTQSDKPRSGRPQFGKPQFGKPES
jgi:ribosomal subunit interface protein